MFPEQMWRTGFKFLEQMTDSYTDLMFFTMKQNVKNFELFKNQLDNFIEVTTPSNKATPSEEELQKQVNILTRRLNNLEKNRNASVWRSSGQPAMSKPTY